MKTDEVLKQTCVQEDFFKELKAYAAKRGLRLKDVYEQAVILLIQRRRELQEQGKRLIYLASPKEGKEVNIVLRKSLVFRVNNISKADKTSVRRFLYTSLIGFAKEHNVRYD